MTERENHERVFEFLCMCERRRVQRVISWSCWEELRETAGGVKNFVEKVLKIYLFCHTDKRLVVSHKINDMKYFRNFPVTTHY